MASTERLDVFIGQPQNPNERLRFVAGTRGDSISLFISPDRSPHTHTPHSTGAVEAICR